MSQSLTAQRSNIHSHAVLAGRFWIRHRVPRSKCAKCISCASFPPAVRACMLSSVGSEPAGCTHVTRTRLSQQPVSRMPGCGQARAWPTLSHRFSGHDAMSGLLGVPLTSLLLLLLRLSHRRRARTFHATNRCVRGARCRYDDRKSHTGSRRRPQIDCLGLAADNCGTVGETARGNGVRIVTCTN